VKYAAKRLYDGEMPFDASVYGPEAASILALDGNGERLMPLAEGRCSSGEARRRIGGVVPAVLFPGARAPEAAQAGLYLYFSCLDEAHTVAQGLGSAEGSYWHAIVHRQEPDAGNSAYWFRRVGAHAVFPALRDAAAACGYRAGKAWDPFAFIDYCERARRRPGSDEERIAREVQRVEWQLLFHHCAAAYHGGYASRSL
jgi:hypothetical protein